MPVKRDREYGDRPIQLAVVVSHPIQHFVPFYRALSQVEGLSITVLYASKIGSQRYFDRDMNTHIKWSMDLHSGYQYKFLPEADAITHASAWSVFNPSIRTELTSLDPDVVLIYGYAFRTARIALSWCVKTHTPAIMISDSELLGRRVFVKRAVKALVVPRILKRFSAFVTVGDCNEDYYAHYGVPRERMFRSPFTIDEELYRQTRARRQHLRNTIRPSWEVADTDLVVLTVGKVSERKRTRDVLDVAALLKSSDPANRVRFVVAGDGADLGALKMRAKAEDLSVTFLGFVNVDRLCEVYAASDVIAHPSSRDPHPLVMSEAACLGLPLVVSSQVGAVGPTDIARQGENAIVFPVGDTSAMAGALKDLRDNPEKLTRMGRRSIEIFDELDIGRSVQGLLDAVSYCAQRIANKSR
jgi:glycosyltransferase involved in cell wall biosynthesis